MKKLLFVIVAVVLIGGGAFLFLKKGNDDEILGGTTPNHGSTSQNTPAPSSASTTYKDGTYKGDAVPTDRGYGTVQIAAVVSGGKITDIQFLQMPDLPGHTQEVTAFAQPILKQEAIAAQNSSVDVVSGATQDTSAFQQSLASALAQAK